MSADRERFEALWDAHFDAVLGYARRGERRGMALRRRIEAQPAAAVPDPRDHIGESLAVRAAFRSLPAGDRETLALIAWDGLTPSEAAVVTGCSPARFRARLFRARRRLRHALDGDGTGDVPTTGDQAATAQEETR